MRIRIGINLTALFMWFLFIFGLIAGPVCIIDTIGLLCNIERLMLLGERDNITWRVLLMITAFCLYKIQQGIIVNLKEKND